MRRIKGPVGRVESIERRRAIAGFNFKQNAKFAKENIVADIDTFILDNIPNMVIAGMKYLYESAKLGLVKLIRVPGKEPSDE